MELVDNRFFEHIVFDVDKIFPSSNIFVYAISGKRYLFHHFLISLVEMVTHLSG